MQSIIISFGIGIAVTTAANFYLNKLKEKRNRKWSNKIVKESILELVGFTPVVKLNSLSKALGCLIYVCYPCDLAKTRESESREKQQGPSGDAHGERVRREVQPEHRPINW